MVTAVSSSLPAGHPCLFLSLFTAGQNIKSRMFRDSKDLFNSLTSTSHSPTLQVLSFVHLAHPRSSRNILGSTQLSMVALLESTSSGKLLIY